MSSFDQLRGVVADHGDYLLAAAYQLTHDRASAQDLVQDALLAVVEAERRRGLEMTNPLAYVLTTMTRRFLRLKTAKGFASQSGYDQLAEIPDKKAGIDTRLAEQDSIWHALNELSRPQRAVLVLRYIGDLSDTRIAAILECPESTVRSHASRGLAAIRSHFPDHTLAPVATKQEE